GHDLTLWGDDGPELAAHGPGLEISVREVGRQFFGPSLDDDLTLQIWPIKGQADLGIGLYRPALLTVVVRIENKALVGVFFQQYDPALGKAIQAEGGNGHGIGFIDSLTGLHLIKPLLELFQGVFFDSDFVQATFFIRSTVISQIFLHDVNFVKIQFTSKPGGAKNRLNRTSPRIRARRPSRHRPVPRWEKHPGPPAERVPGIYSGWNNGPGSVGRPRRVRRSGQPVWRWNAWSFHKGGIP